MDKRCAPGKKYENGSCFIMNEILVLCKAYNKHNVNDQIDTYNKSKKQLIMSLTNKLNNVCNDQICWLKQDFVKNLNDNVKNKLMTSVFRPEGPGSYGNFKWLNTTNINEVMTQYETIYKDYKWFGALPADFNDIYMYIKNIDLSQLLNDNINQLGFVFNHDTSRQSGSHWVALYVNISKLNIYYFDSYGYKPKKEVVKLIHKLTAQLHKIKKKEFKQFFFTNKKKFNPSEIDVRYNEIRHQYKNSECGVYSMNFILRLLKGESFFDITNNITKDDDVNKCREVYFTNEN